MATLIVKDAEQTYVVDLVHGEALVVGRGADCDLPVSGDRASRRHAEVRSEGQGHAVTDLGSTNGTLVNGAPIAGMRLLADGDVVDVGGSTLLYRVHPPA